MTPVQKAVLDDLDFLAQFANRFMWRGMNTAPRTGEKILIYVPYDDDGEVYKIASWGPSPYPTGWTFCGGWIAADEPLAWMPLPDPPPMIESE